MEDSNPCFVTCLGVIFQRIFHRFANQFLQYFDIYFFKLVYIEASLACGMLSELLHQVFELMKAAHHKYFSHHFAG